MGDTWYYSKGGADRQGPVSQSEIQRLLSVGELRPNDLVWTEGMAAWSPASSRPELGVAAAPAAAVISAPTTSAAGPAGLPAGLLGWATFVGVMHIVGGIFQCLSCVGIVIGIPMVMAGTALLGAKSTLESMSAVDPAFAPFLDKFKSYVTAMGVVFIIGIVVTTIMLIFYIGIFATAFSQARGMN
ncbi:MAG: DUF4339 domain-containing protein [Kiritimatiellae bacterium]|nr:DUF4339 domain-containing protein [Kiritimatiellia bacterium]